MLREYLELMQQLWTEEVASYEGEFAHLKPSWACPKPVQQPRIPILVGAGGTPKNFDWIVANADGWITTPIETDIEDRVTALNKAWATAGREGDPRVVVLLTSRLEPGQLRSGNSSVSTRCCSVSPTRSPRTSGSSSHGSAPR